MLVWVLEESSNSNAQQIKCILTARIHTQVSHFSQIVLKKNLGIRYILSRDDFSEILSAIVDL